MVQVCKDPRLEDSLESHGYISTLACFDLESFPFVAWANSAGIYIVNLKEGRIEPLALSEQRLGTRGGCSPFQFFREDYLQSQGED